MAFRPPTAPEERRTVGLDLRNATEGVPYDVSGPAAIGVVFGCVYLLAAANAYFTRLVVTNRRVVILQGHAISYSWGIDDLPRHLIRYERRGGEESRTIDLDALQTMLGGSSDG